MTCCCHENGQRKLGMVKTVQQDWYDITLRDVTCNDKQYAEMQTDMLNAQQDIRSTASLALQHLLP